MEVEDAAHHRPSDESAQGVGCSRDAEGASMPEGFMRRFRRKKEQDNRPQADMVSVELSAPLPARGASVMAQTLLKHLLFIRQQIPMPFDQLSKEVTFQKEKAENEEADSGQRCRRPSAALRKTTQLVESIEAVLHGFEQLPTKGQGKQVV
eukprot:CAMPEP_0179419898 /NCGR_PEP_ID=MMETSP0799-20121207/8864_1 /TAXON_ID=46947 /ORGANISM="Geminigera cryophila, Strain CCMP2564" /LENGTH=150 /DNA_ID=CAMNT_0021193441 /DNA_START=5 /DNA_END=453 /DNA_ORIENTATION=+